jgi:hypothetical protein
VVSVRSTSIDAVELCLAGKVNSVREQLTAVAESRLSEALFSSAAVLVEGGTEKAVFEGLAEKKDQISLFSSGITIVDVGGKGNIMLAHVILSQLGIPCYVVFDGDKNGGSVMLSHGKDKKIVDNKIRNDIALNRKLLAYLGVEEEDFPVTAAYDRYAVIEDTLEPLLMTEWSGWAEEIRSVVDSGLATDKKNALRYLIAARRVESDPPEFLTDVLKRVHLLVG